MENSGIIRFKNQIKRNVLVRFKDNYEPTSLSQKYLMDEDFIYIADNHLYNDTHDFYIYLRSGSGLNSGFAYIKDIVLDLRNPELLPYYQVFLKNEDDSLTELERFNFLTNAHDFINVNGHTKYKRSALFIKKLQLVNNEIKELEF